MVLLVNISFSLYFINRKLYIVLYELLSKIYYYICKTIYYSLIISKKSYDYDKYNYLDAFIFGVG